MRYAIWNLIEDIPNYLDGPESEIAELGGNAEGAWADGIIEKGADILGYVTGEFDASALAHWNYREVTQAEALAYCQAINPQAYIVEDGRILAPIQE